MQDSPNAQACGMGLNSFFFVAFILPNMVNPIEGYHQGLCVILISGIIFLLLSVTGARAYVAKALPDCLKKAVPAGIVFSSLSLVSKMPVSFRQISTHSFSFLTSMALFPEKPFSKAGKRSLLWSSLSSDFSSSPCLKKRRSREASLFRSPQ